MGSWLAACRLHGTVAFQLTRRASFVSSQATRYFAFTRNHTVLSWGKPCSMWHVLRVFICGLKAHCRHITEFGTCSSSADGQHTFDQSAQEWKRLTERRSKKAGELSSSAVISFVCHYCANFKLTAVAVRSKKKSSLLSKLESAFIQDTIFVYLGQLNWRQQPFELTWCVCLVVHQASG